MLVSVAACRQKPAVPESKVMYTCPMPEDSVFSDKPGQCPKCGMELIEVAHDHSGFSAEYTCPMHPEIVKESPGQCPICHMDLVKRSAEPMAGPDVRSILKASEASVVTRLPFTTLQDYAGTGSGEVFGEVGYDPRQVGNISSRVTGRIDKLYVRYRFQEVKKGQKIMDVYSPELVTAQQELLFLVVNDPENAGLIEAAMQKLYLMGMEASQVNSVIRQGKPRMSVSVFSPYAGHVHDGAGLTMETDPSMNEQATVTQPLSLQEGMYVEKGKPVLTIFNHRQVWALFNLQPEQAAGIKVGDEVHIQAELAGNHTIDSRIEFIEPYFRQGSKLLVARASLKEHQHLPVGTPLKGRFDKKISSVPTLPRTAVVNLGIRNIVFKKEDGTVKPVQVNAGRILADRIEILSGLQPSDSVVVNGQYLVDQESFIHIKP